MSTPTTTAGPLPQAAPAPPPSPARARGPARLRALDGLRLLAALMVAAYHFGGRDGEVGEAWGTSPAEQFPTLSPLFAYGCLGVQVFFVISGFVICMTGWRAAGTGDGVSRLRRFAVSRVTRLMPAYWAAIGLVTLVFALPPVVYEAVSPSDVLVNLTMLQQPLGVDRVLGVCWTLWAEVRFYALFALCVVLPGPSRRRVVLFCAAWLLGTALAEASGSALLDLVLMPEYAPFFTGGVGLYLVHRYGHDATAWAIVGVSWLLGQHYAVRELWHPPDPEFFSYRPSLGIIAVVTLGFAAVAAVALGALNWADWRWLTTAGALTYPFYLVHEHLGWVAIHLLHRGLALPSWLVLLLTTAAMLLLAWLLHRGVERTLGPRLKRALTAPSAR
ncbi:acyltransferase [Streptomyces sp. HNM0574]|uniref:acyltransferase family protein n=1 Tax=Streptomyces sp. HNM0574 TaxID=2714954 RepID=UPI00146D9B9A|nr:acyltransferase [Streptomyces sp. HNM0574]NLU66784.1 acyltransferase [Streptomyces sp. HNM0574]